MLVIPVFSFAQTSQTPDLDYKGLVPCGNELVGGKIKNPCGFGHMMGLINKTIKFILFDLVLPIAAIMFAYSGVLYIASSANPNTRTKAKKIFGDVAFGFALAVAAWLIIRTVLSILGYNGTWIGF
jgi:hypothetical protein